MWRLADAASARQSGRGPSGRRHLADAVSGRRGVCQTVWHRAVWQTASGRRRLPDTSARLSGRRTWHLGDTACQMPSGRCGVWQTPHLQDSLADGIWLMAVWQTASGRHSVWQTASDIVASGRQRLQDGNRQTASARRRLLDTVSARRCLADTTSGRCGVWQTRCLADARQSGTGPSGRYRLADAV